MFVYQRVHSGQISSRPHTTEKSPQKAAVWFREMGPLISGTSRLVKYYSIWPDTSTQTVGTFSIVIRSFSGESLFLLHFVDVNIYIYGTWFRSKWFMKHLGAGRTTCFAIPQVNLH